MKTKTLAEMAVQIVNYKTKLPTFKLSITTHFSKKVNKKRKNRKFRLYFYFLQSQHLRLQLGIVANAFFVKKKQCLSELSLLNLLRIACYYFKT